MLLQPTVASNVAAETDKVQETLLTILHSGALAESQIHTTADESKILYH